MKGFGEAEFLKLLNVCLGSHPEILAVSNSRLQLIP
jgi:hypothetical protein